MKFFNKKNKKTRPAEPRSTEELNKAYAEELAKLGQNSYLVFVYTKEVEASNQRLLNINQEAAARNALDKATKASEPQGEVNEQV